MHNPIGVHQSAPTQHLLLAQTFWDIKKGNTLCAVTTDPKPPATNLKPQSCLTETAARLVPKGLRPAKFAKRS